MSQLSPRQIIREDFKIDLPIHGGWGFSREDACVIDALDPTVPKEVPFDGVGVEHVFVEKRIYEQLIISRAPDERMSGIKWKLNRQYIVDVDDRKFDHLAFYIEFLRDQDFDELKAAWEANYGRIDFDVAAHLSRHESLLIRVQQEFWFDITSFFGRR